MPGRNPLSDNRFARAGLSWTLASLGDRQVAWIPSGPSMNSATTSSLLRPVDIADLEQGNTGIPWAHRFDSGRNGPSVLVTALVHGNELCGAHALRRMVDLGIRPTRGSVTICLCNVAAYISFDPVYPARSRFIDEDFNRVWDREVLDGIAHRSNWTVPGR